MLQNILKLNGAQELNKTEQKAINGGLGPLQSACCNPLFECCAPHNPGDEIPFNACGAHGSMNCNFLFSNAPCCV